MDRLNEIVPSAPQLVQELLAVRLANNQLDHQVLDRELGAPTMSLRQSSAHPALFFATNIFSFSYSYLFEFLFVMGYER
jgi:hypothetical protein